MSSQHNHNYLKPFLDFSFGILLCFPFLYFFLALLFPFAVSFVVDLAQHLLFFVSLLFLASFAQPLLFLVVPLVAYAHEHYIIVCFFLSGCRVKLRQILRQN